MTKQRMVSGTKPTGRQKTKGHGKRSKMSGSDYRSSKYRDKSGYECYARNVGNGVREMVEPERLNHYDGTNGAYDSIGSALPVKDKQPATDSSGYRGTVPDFVKRRNASGTQYRADVGYGSADSGKLSVSETPSRPTIPIKDVPWDYREKEVEVTDAWGTIRKETRITDKPERGYWAGGLVGRKEDARNIPHQKSDKTRINKTVGYPLENERYPRAVDKVR